MEIRGIRGWRYCPQDGDVSSLIAPPYDVLDQAGKDELLARSEHNIVKVDLPHVPPKGVGPDEVYKASADTLAGWKADGVICQDDKSTIYAYQQTYEWSGKCYKRTAMICSIRATALGEDVIPHEHTFDGPKADRLKLTESTQMQLSPIFGLYNDPNGQVAAGLEAAMKAAPAIKGDLNGVTEELWPIDDPAAVAKIAETLRDVPAYIADGHHRYTTAMNHAKALREAGTIDNDHETNFVMFVLVADDAPGLLVLPTHRMVTGLSDDFTPEKLMAAADDFEWQCISGEGVNLDDADEFLKPYGPTAMALLAAGSKDIWIGKLTNPAAMLEAAPDECEAWRELDVAILQKLLIDKALVPWKTDATNVDYTAYGQIALDAVADGSVQMAIVMQGTPLKSVFDIADAGASMPHKSTYFYPKVATGLVLKPLQ